MTLISVPQLRALRKKISLMGRRFYHDIDKVILTLEIGCGAQLVAVQGLYQTAYQPEIFVFVSHYVTRFVYPRACDYSSTQSIPNKLLIQFCMSPTLIVTLPPGQQRGRGWSCCMGNKFRSQSRAGPSCSFTSYFFSGCVSLFNTCDWKMWPQNKDTDQGSMGMWN